MQTKPCNCASIHLIGMLFTLRVRFGKWCGESNGKGVGCRGGVAGCEYCRPDWKLIKPATALHHSTLVPELSFKRHALQAAITEAYRSLRWQGSTPDGSGQGWKFRLLVRRSFTARGHGWIKTAQWSNRIRCCCPPTRRFAFSWEDVKKWGKKNLIHSWKTTLW